MWIFGSIVLLCGSLCLGRLLVGLGLGVCGLFGGLEDLQGGSVVVEGCGWECGVSGGDDVVVWGMFA